MATLSLRIEETFADGSPVALTLSSVLRPWLRGHWALLFSHADDFACRDLESDRWTVVLEQSLSAARVRPLAFAARAAVAGYGGWVTQVGGAAVALAPEESYRGPRLFDLAARELRDAVTRAASRFVMVVDESLRLRRTFEYAPGDRLPSPLDFAALAQRLRCASRIAA
jgi:hypothetical protein